MPETLSLFSSDASLNGLFSAECPYSIGTESLCFSLIIPEYLHAGYNQAALAIRAQGAITLDVTAEKPYTVRLVNVRALSANGADIRIEGDDSIVTPKAACMTVNC